MNWASCRALSTAALGCLGEEHAAAFIRGRGFDVVARNVRVGRGEIDIVARISGKRTAVEVRSIRRNPATGVVAIDAFDPEKSAQVRKLAGAARCGRVDLITVCFREEGVDVHWVPRVS